MHSFTQNISNCYEKGAQPPEPMHTHRGGGNRLPQTLQSLGATPRLRRLSISASVSSPTAIFLIRPLHCGSQYETNKRPRHA